MAVTRASVDTVKLLSTPSDQRERFKQCLILHNFIKEPFLSEFIDEDKVFTLSHPIYQRCEADGRVFYFVLEKNTVHFDDFLYPAYPLQAVFRMMKKSPTIWLSPKNQYVMLAAKIRLHHLSKEQNNFLHKICEHVIKADGEHAYLSREHQVIYPLGNKLLNIFLNLSAPMIATKVNKEPIGDESPYRWRVLGKVLGEGGYGRVHEATLKFTPSSKGQFSASLSPVVFKFMPNGDKRVNEMLAHEHSILLGLGIKPKPLAFYHDKSLGDVSVLGMRKYDGREYFDIADKEFTGSSYLKAEQRLYVAIHCAQRMAAIHKHEILHNDIKDSNVIISENWDAEIIDFGLSAPVGYQRLGIYGTPGHIAPEVLANKFYSYKSDIFSYGCLFREIFNIGAEQPLDKQIHALEEIISELDSDQEEHIDALYENITRYRNRQSRLTSIEAFLHPAIKDINREQRKKLESLYLKMHHLHPKLRPSFDQIIDKLNHILLSILISSYPKQKHQWEAIFKSANYFKAKMAQIVDEAVTLESVTNLLNIFGNKKHKIPSEIDSHFARCLDIKLLYEATNPQQVLQLTGELFSSFITCYQRLLIYREKVTTSKDEKFKRDVARVDQRFHDIKELTIDNVVKLVNGLHKDLALLDKYYSASLLFFPAASSEVGSEVKVHEMAP